MSSFVEREHANAASDSPPWASRSSAKRRATRSSASSQVAGSNSPVFHHEVELAAHAAMRARGAHALGLPRAVPRAALLGERAGGARLRAVSARLAVGGAPPLAERRLDERAHAPLADAQRMVARGVVARAHAALAADAQVGVVGEEGVGIEHRLARPRRLVGRFEHAVLAADGLQLAGAVLVAREAVVRGIQPVIGDDELERYATVRLDARRVRDDGHAVLAGRRTRGHRLVEPLHVHDAHAARGDGAAFLQEAQRGDADAGFARGIEDGRALCHLERRSVYRDARHTGACPLPTRRSRTGRSADSVRIPARLPRGSCPSQRLRNRVCARARAAP